MSLSPPRSAGSRVPGTIAVLAALTALAPLSIDIYTPSLPAIQRELDTTSWLVQASITACLLGIGVGQLVWGPMSDRHGRRPVIMAGVAGWAIACLLSGMTSSAEAFLATRALAGLCGAAGIVVARSVVRDLSDDTRTISSRIGLLAIVTAIAPVVAPAAGTAIAYMWGWRADFFALAAFGGALLLAFALFVPESLPPASRSHYARFAIARALGGAVRERELRWVALSLAAHAFGFYAYISTATFIIEEELGYPNHVFAIVFGTNAVAMLCANLVFRRLARRWHPAVPSGIGLAACALAGMGMVIAAAVAAPSWLLWGLSLVFATGTGFVLPGALSWGQATATASGAASGLTGSAQFLGGVLGSPVTGLLGLTAGNLGLVIAAGSSSGLAAWALAHRARRRAVETD